MAKTALFIEEFNKKHGCLESIDFKNRTFEISDGTLFCVTVKKKRLHKY